MIDISSSPPSFIYLRQTLLGDIGTKIFININKTWESERKSKGKGTYERRKGGREWYQIATRQEAESSGKFGQDGK